MHKDCAIDGLLDMSFDVDGQSLNGTDRVSSSTFRIRSETCQRKATVIDAATRQLLSESTNRQLKSFESTMPLLAGIAVIVHLGM